ncbi:hypothetical protein SNE510_72940 [Streptomyces sp. NE5-10]|uniref:DUF7878 domain-containing protein n=1 Tax=Streptomyces sp. NE5-10 TaxID=2759674 RepID=UPI0019081D47|nr:hypothetical protein [Streptomyces sp. NE5-10]GHJ97775.1 hypothetical protein SNE510_72940 [Streptomyces sp. NE5-10]
MKFECRNFGAPDLPRRGLTASSAPLEIPLVDIEADLVISDNGRVVWSEEAFAAAELAYGLVRRLHLADRVRGDFTFDSSYDETGAVRIVATDEGWRVGSAFAADAQSSPVPWKSLVPDLLTFIEDVRVGVGTLGVSPDLVPGF